MKAPFQLLDRYLLTRFPAVWAAGTHRFFLFSFLLGNVALFVLALALPVRRVIDEGFRDEAQTALTIALVGLMAFTVWRFGQRARLGGESRRFAFAFLANALMLFSNCLVFSAGLRANVAASFSEGTLAGDLALLERLAPHEEYARGRWIVNLNEESAPLVSQVADMAARYAVPLAPHMPAVMEEGYTLVDMGGTQDDYAALLKGRVAYASECRAGNAPLFHASWALWGLPVAMIGFMFEVRRIRQRPAG